MMEVEFGCTEMVLGNRLKCDCGEDERSKINQSFTELQNAKSELDRLKQENEKLQKEALGLKGRYDNVSELLALICGPDFESKHGVHGAVNRAIYNYNELQQNQAKLIEALKPFTSAHHTALDFWKASQTMKEVCGEEKKD